MVLDEVWSVLLVCLALNASREDERTNEGMPAVCSQQGRASLTHSLIHSFIHALERATINEKGPYKVERLISYPLD
jgi:predicted RNA polymerase sigma factor